VDLAPEHEDKRKQTYSSMHFEL